MAIKIGIYGDSFAEVHHAPQYTTWINRLEELSGYTCKTHALAATGIDYSYYKFLETYQDYDIILFFASSFERFSIISESKGIFTHHSFMKLSNRLKDVHIWHQENQAAGNKDFPPLDKNIVGYQKSLQKYSLYFPRTWVLGQMAMLDSIKYKHPKVFIINCFDRRLPEYTYGMENIFLADKKKFKATTEVYSIRKNHLTEKQNIEFGNYIYNHITYPKFDVHNTFKDVHNYYTISSTITEAGLRK